MRSLRLMFVVALTLPVFASAAADPVTSKEPAESVVKRVLKERFPEVNIVSVKPSVLPGVYEVFAGDSIAYSDAKGEYLLSGAILETRSKRNVTADRLDELTSIDVKSLPLEHAIKTVKGDGKRRLVIFSDPDCPFCQKLEKELATVTNVTIYTFLFPLAELHPEAPAKAKAIWCASDRSAAWAHWMLQQKLPASASCDVAVIDENIKLGEKLRVGSTPTLFSGSGRRVSGTMAAAQIETLIDSDQKTAASAGGAAAAR